MAKEWIQNSVMSRFQLNIQEMVVVDKIHGFLDNLPMKDIIYHVYISRGSAS